MKGIAAWIWIVSSILLGITIVILGSKIIVEQLQSQQKNNMLEQTDTFFRKLNNVCLKGGIGEMYGFQMAVPEMTKAIYVGNETNEFPPDKVSTYITKGISAVGSHLCLQFFDENLPKCLELPCQTNMTYFGMPSLKSDLPSIIARLSGASPVYRYRVVINKTEEKFLTVKAVQIVK